MLGLVDTLLSPSAVASNERSAVADFWYQPIASATASGVRVDADTAMRLSAVWACVGLISETVASLPLHLYEMTGPDRRRDTDHGLYRLLHDQPNDWQTAFDYRQFKMVCTLLRGNNYSYKLLDDDGNLDQLIPLHPDFVRTEKIRVGTAPGGLPLHALRYLVRLTDGSEIPFLADEIHHVRGLSLDGMTGVSVIEYARQTLGLSLALEEHGARYFGNGARPGGILAPDAPMDKDALLRLKTEWNSTFQGVSNSHKIAALPVAVKYTPLSINNEDSQFLESRDFEIADVARWFGRVPLHMIGHTTNETSWGTGIEQMSIGFVVYCLRPYLIREEQAIKRDLIPDRDHFAEHDIAGLLRGDAKSRAEALDIARRNGIINAEFWARTENWPVPEGDAGQAYWRPVNMVDANDPPEPAQAPPSSQSPVDSNQPPSKPDTASGGAHYRLLVHDAAQRVLRRELHALEKAAKRYASDPAGWRTETDTFYADHAVFVAEALRVPAATAGRYVADQVASLGLGGAALLDDADWRLACTDRLVNLVLEES